MSETFRIVVVSAGERPKRTVSKIREVTGFSLAKAEWFLQHLPQPLIEGLQEQYEIDRIKKLLEDAGAKVLVQLSKSRAPMMLWHPHYDNLSFVSTQFPPKPYSFSWVLNDRLGGMGRPSGFNDLDFLRSLGLDLLISLTEIPLLEPFTSLLDCTKLHFPVPDLGRPSDEQTDAIVSQIHRVLNDGGKAVVHCGAGMGRTGVVLSCYLVFTGMSAIEALQIVRSTRPGSVETEEQERCVLEYEQRLRPKPQEGGTPTA